MDEKHLDFYANAVNVTTGVYDVTLYFRTQSPVFIEEDQQPTMEVSGTCSVRMSPQHAKSLAALLTKHVRQYEQDHELELPVPKNIQEFWKENIK
jgi:hypothetical protein